MKKALTALTLALAAYTSATLAAGMSEIGPSDNGSYVFLNKQGAPTEMFMRLSRGDDKWIVEIKKPGGQWQNTICEQGCDYSKSSAQDIQRYFPADWRANTEIACIQNMAQAFCRYKDKVAPFRSAYVVIALATSRPIPMFIRRVGQLENPLLSPD